MATLAQWLNTSYYISDNRCNNIAVYYVLKYLVQCNTVAGSWQHVTGV